MSCGTGGRCVLLGWAMRRPTYNIGQPQSWAASTNSRRVVQSAAGIRLAAAWIEQRKIGSHCSFLTRARSRPIAFPPIHKIPDNQPGIINMAQFTYSASARLRLDGWHALDLELEACPGLRNIRRPPLRFPIFILQPRSKSVFTRPAFCGREARPHQLRTVTLHEENCCVFCKTRQQKWYTKARHEQRRALRISSE